MSLHALARHLTHGREGSQPSQLGASQLYRADPILLESRAFAPWFLTIIMRFLSWFILASLSVLLCSAPGSTQAKSGSTYKVQGTVIAITLNQTPPLIVVKTPLGPKNHMTVGAAVTAQTKIIRGNKRIALNTIREGETVWLTYVKAPGGVLAEVIRVSA
jgi:hypothetical protein